MRFAFIAAEKAAVPVRVLCRTLAVSRAGFDALGMALERRQPRPGLLLKASARAQRSTQRVHAASICGYAAHQVPPA